jgi:hypothetical protein
MHNGALIFNRLTLWRGISDPIVAARRQTAAIFSEFIMRLSADAPLWDLPPLSWDEMNPFAF